MAAFASTNGRDSWLNLVLARDMLRDDEVATRMLDREMG